MDYELYVGLCGIALRYFEFIVLKYSQIYYKYFQFNKYTKLQYPNI